VIAFDTDIDKLGLTLFYARRFLAVAASCPGLEHNLGIGIRLSVCLSVCHKSVLCETNAHAIFTTG